MSRSPSPASSLDFVDSSGSEAEYVPVRRKRAAPARRAGAAAPKGPVKINLTALHRAQAVASAHPVEGDVDEDDEDDGGDMVMGRRTVDLSGLDLKADHAARPLWVDEHGNMYVTLADQRSGSCCCLARTNHAAFWKLLQHSLNRRKSF